ncbi:hypothetical protein QEG73_05400 [Chitinophagaceae bacterium 26-R-25]|nr:hypothetical protein [Chitinophagaceae bacterium 26-R-25]
MKRGKAKEIIDGLVGLVGLVALVLLVYFIYCGYNNYQSFKQRDKTVVTVAHIEGGSNGHKGSLYFNIWYMMGNERKDEEVTELDLRFSIIRRLVGKTVPMVYLKDNPEDKRLLILEKDFEMINLPYPDSMHWTREYKFWLFKLAHKL